MQRAQRAFSPHRTDRHHLLAKTGTGRTTEDYRNNQNVFLQGEVVDSVFFIQKGRVKLIVTSEQGKEAIVGILNEGQFFWRRMPPVSTHAERHGDSVRQLLHYLDDKSRDAIRDPRPAEILQPVHGTLTQPE
jgi:hypothetical protein